MDHMCQWGANRNPRAGYQMSPSLTTCRAGVEKSTFQIPANQLEVGKRQKFHPTVLFALSLMQCQRRLQFSRVNNIDNVFEQSCVAFRLAPPYGGLLVQHNTKRKSCMCWSTQLICFFWFDVANFNVVVLWLKLSFFGSRTQSSDHHQTWKKNRFPHLVI